MSLAFGRPAGRPGSDRLRAVAIAGSSAVGGAVAAFFLDRDRGHRRRVMARQRVRGIARRSVRRGERLARHAGSETIGLAQRVAHPQSSQKPPPDDISLARKVETEIFRAADVPKGTINVNAENGVVYLRGTADSAERIRALEHQTSAIPGVRGVRNLLKLPS